MPQVTIRKVEQSWVEKGRAVAARRKVSLNQVFVEGLRRGRVRLWSRGGGANLIDLPGTLISDLAGLQQRGTPMPTNDIWITTIALECAGRSASRDAHFDCLPQVARVVV